MNRPDFILGIDPGMQGALALYNVDVSNLAKFGPAPAVALFDMPQAEAKGIDAPKLADTISTIHGLVPEGAQLLAVVENVNSRPRQAGAFAFGLSTGIIHGILAAYGIKFDLVSPAQWKPAMGLGRMGEETQAQTKDRARELAQGLFPGLAKQFSLKKHDGRAEALLIAVYYATKGKGK